MQKNLNEKYYLRTQKELRNLALKSSKLNYGQLIGEFNRINNETIWTNWGIHGNLTKKALIEYLEVINRKINKSDKGFKFLGIYLFDKEIKLYRKKLHKQYNLDFKE